MAANDVLTYDPTQVVVAIGVIPIDNFEEMEIDQDEDSFGFEVGSSGEVSRIYNASTLTTYKLTLPQTSMLNTKLTVAYATKAFQNILVSDFNGTEVFSMPKGTIIKPPTTKLSKDSLNTKEWTIKGPAILRVIGGNL